MKSRRAVGTHMDPSPDELAGVVDLFGGLTRAELGEALSELAFKRGADVGTDAFAEAIETAVASYCLVAVDHEAADDTADSDGRDLLVPGPAAFPELPDGATDLPHIMGVETRQIDRAAAVAAARTRLEGEAETAREAGDGDRIDQLLDVTYDLEAWAGVDLASLREELDEARE
jgi:hypothetical protein